MSRTAAVLALTLTCAVPAAAQDAYLAHWLEDLPSGGNLFALLESAQPEITTDRFNSGGLNGGTPERMSAFLASWSQTQYRIGSINIASPVDGTPMLFPELAWWSAVGSDAARLSSSSATGLSVVLTPEFRQRGSVEFLGSTGALSQQSPLHNPPAIAELDDAMQATAIIGRGIGERVQLVLGGKYSKSSVVERRATAASTITRSIFAATQVRLANDRRLETIAWLQGMDAMHFQTSLVDQRWHLHGGYTQRSRERRVSVSAGWQSRDGSTHRWMLAGEMDATSATGTGPFDYSLVERAGDVPARLWRYARPTRAWRRRALSITASANDRIALTPNITLDAGLKASMANGSARGAANGVEWRTLLPAVHLEWNLRTPLKLNFLTGVSRTADQLLLGLLAYGDPDAPTAFVYRVAGPLVARAGPGTGGDPAFSAIDPDLKRPVTDQFILQLESRPTPSLRLRVTGLARRQSSLINVVNIGVPTSGYTTFTIPDANADWVNPVDDQQLVVYNRKPETFGLDRYLLTNPDVEDATMGAVVVSGEVIKSRVIFRIGGTASAAVGSGGNRGFTAIENDQSVLGELFANPNAATYARGRLFNDRAYTIKSMAIVRLPADFRVGAIARFQDGQPFSRLAVVEGLNQGAEAIQTFPRGRSRFSYRATLDVRVQKQLAIGGTRLDLIADAYNLLNAASEVEEYVVTGPRFREITAVQPPRSFHLGARVTF